MLSDLYTRFDAQCGVYDVYKVSVDSCFFSALNFRAVVVIGGIIFVFALMTSMVFSTIWKALDDCNISKETSTRSAPVVLLLSVLAVPLRTRGSVS